MPKTENIRVIRDLILKVLQFHSELCKLIQVQSWFMKHEAFYAQNKLTGLLSISQFRMRDFSRRIIKMTNDGFGRR